jgi:hypothetical protein
MVFPAKSKKNILQEMENKINSNKTDRRVVTDNPEKNVYIFAFEISFGLITKRDLDNHYRN